MYLPSILSVGTTTPPYKLDQNETMRFAKEFFKDDYEDIQRLLSVFHNGQIKQRYFSASLEWFAEEHTFEEKNTLYCDIAVKYGVEVIRKCLDNPLFLDTPIPEHNIDAIFFISTTGLSTPSIDAKIMNHLTFNPHLKRIPIWGLGCAGGASGLARCYEYCQANPNGNALLLSVELCSLTFQYNDRSKSNLIGTSLFSDGLACALIVGDKSPLRKFGKAKTIPAVKDTQSTLMPNSEDVMGWDVRNEGLFVVFSKSIPSIVEQWFKPNAEEFLHKQKLETKHIDHFIAHPGGRKVIEAYEKALGLTESHTEPSRKILTNYGNMSSPTVLFVLEEVMRNNPNIGEKGLMVSLGPGFSSELLLLEWESPK